MTIAILMSYLQSTETGLYQGTNWGKGRKKNATLRVPETTVPSIILKLTIKTRLRVDHLTKMSNLDKRISA